MQNNQEARYDRVYKSYCKSTADNTMPVYTDSRSIKNKIYEEYRKNDTELNSLFFDFQVKMPEKELLKIYSEVVHVIDGDDVMKLEDVKIQSSDFSTNTIIGRKMDLIPEGQYEEIYEGSFKDFLESFNNREKETGIYRITLIAENALKIVSGYKLDFVW